MVWNKAKWLCGWKPNTYEEGQLGEELDPAISYMPSVNEQGVLISNHTSRDS